MELGDNEGWRGGGDDEVSAVVLRRLRKDNDHFVEKKITVQFYSFSVTTTTAAFVVITRLPFKV